MKWLTYPEKIITLAVLTPEIQALKNDPIAFWKPIGFLWLNSKKQEEEERKTLAGLQ